MINILFISDDALVGRLIELLQPNFRARMRLAPDFDQGLKEVFDNRPSAVFIQNDISGISGETVARHIKTLLRTDAPYIVLVHKTPLKPQGVKKWFDDAIDLSLPEQELVESVKRQLMKIGPEQWQEGRAVDAVGTTREAPVAVDEVPPPAGEPEGFDTFDWEMPETPLAAKAPDRMVPPPPVPPAAPQTAQPKPGPAVVSSAPEAAVTIEKQPPLRPEEPAVAKAKEIAPSFTAAPVESVSAQVAPSKPKEPAASLAAFKAEVPDALPKGSRVTAPPPGKLAVKEGSRAVRAVAVSLVAVFIVAAGAGYYYLTKKSGRAISAKGSAPVSAPRKPLEPGKTSEPAWPAPAPPRGASTTKLPSFIPVNKIDTGFAKTHPGWERYLGNANEYRVFREDGRVRAVQVIARGGKGVSEGLLSTAVRELTGSVAREAAASSVKAGYLVESGRLAGNAEIVVYRKKKGGVRAFVVTLP